MKQIEKRLKKISLNLLSPFIKRKSGNHVKSDWRQFKRILVFRLDNRLGNAILILPLVQSIKKSIPSVKIDVMMSADYIQIYENHPDINRIIPYDQSYLMKNPFRYLSLIRTLRKNQYNVVLSSSNANAFSVSQAIFAGLLAAKHSVGFEWQHSDKLYSDVVKGNTKTQYGDAQVDLWRHFDPQAIVEPPKIYFITSNTNQSEKLNVLFWLGATAKKVLPESMINEILAVLREKRLNYQLAAGPADGLLLDNYSSQWKQEVQFLHGTIKDTAQFFRQFKLIIIPDTGPMHLAVALGIPTVQVFVNSDPTWYAYRGDHHYVINKSLDKIEFEKYLTKIID